MTLRQVLQDTNYSHRTQISLSPLMYKKLMGEKKDMGLAEYIRRIVAKYWLDMEVDAGELKEARKKLLKPIKKKAPSVKLLLEEERNLRKGRI